MRSGNLFLPHAWKALWDLYEVASVTCLLLSDDASLINWHCSMGPRDMERTQTLPAQNTETRLSVHIKAQKKP